MGPAAAPALPQIRAELARPEGGRQFSSIDNDNELRRDLAEILVAIDVSDPAGS